MNFETTNALAATLKDWEKLAVTAVSKGFSRTGNKIHSPDSGVLVGCWDDTQGGGWVAYCEVKA